MKLVVFDLDGTLIDCEAVDEFAKLVGKEKEVSELTHKAMVGEMKFEESLKQRVKFLEGLEIEKVQEAVKSIPIMPGAAETVAQLRRQNIKTGVISGSFDIVTQHVKNELGLDYAISNQLVVENGKLTGEVTGPIMDEDSKGRALEEIAKEAGVSLDECVAVGDGANDISMLNKAGISIAFNPKPVLKNVADVVIKKKDLSEVLAYVLGEQGIEEKTRERDELERKVRQMKREAQEKRSMLQELSAKRKKLIEAIKIKNSEANEHKKLRDELNEKIKQLKLERDKENSAAKELAAEHKKLREKAPAGNFKQVEKEIKNLEWRLQTSVLDMKKEDALVKRIEELKKQLASFGGLIKLEKEIEKHRRASKKIHDEIVRLSNESQEHHNKFIEAVNKIKELEAEIDKLNQEKGEIASNLDKLSSELDASAGRLRVLEKEVKKLEAATDRRGSKKSEREMKEQAKELYERFKKGEKLSLEDIYMLQRFNLV